jgi:hypothetical protein
MICSSVKRLGFMSIPLRGDGLYPFLEEIPGLRSPSHHRYRKINRRGRRHQRGLIRSDMCREAPFEL